LSQIKKTRGQKKKKTIWESQDLKGKQALQGKNKGGKQTLGRGPQLKKKIWGWRKGKVTAGEVWG